MRGSETTVAIAKSLDIDEITTSHFINAPRNDKIPTHPNLVLDLLHAHRVSLFALTCIPLNLFAIRTRFALSVRKSALLKREGTVRHPELVSGSQNETFFSHFTSHFSRKRVAFTLAEVLITLGIIGVVAALTLPSVISKYQKQDMLARLKKVYSVMSNAVDMSIADNGDMNTWDFPESSYYDAGFIPFFRKYYIPYLKIAEECVDSNCFMKENYKPTSYSGEDKSGCAYAGYLVKLSDGTYLYFLSNIGSGYIWMFADINGKKKPNVIGKDIFVFDIYKYNMGGYKVKFWNIGETVDYLVGSQGSGCNRDATQFQGFNCGALIQKSGWKIPDNYPW